MNSVNDWTAKAARCILSDTTSKREMKEERVAAIIALFAAPLIALLEERKHVGNNLMWSPACATVWDDCEAQCDCGADEYNKKLREAFQGPKDLDV